MIRPTWASVYSENPANTSAIRENSRCSSSDSDSQGRTASAGAKVPGVIGLIWVSSVPRAGSPLDHPGQDPLAVGLVAVVELALVPVDVVLGRMVRRVVGAGQNHRYQGLSGSDCLASRI
jgi:hypothetical protein